MYQTAILYPLKGVRRLKDGRYRVERTDGAGVSLTIEEWQSALADMQKQEQSRYGKTSIK